MVWSERNMSLKNPVTPPGIDPGTVRLVAQRLNHYATPGPLHDNTAVKSLSSNLYDETPYAVSTYPCMLHFLLITTDIITENVWGGSRIYGTELWGSHIVYSTSFSNSCSSYCNAAHLNPISVPQHTGPKITLLTTYVYAKCNFLSVLYIYLPSAIFSKSIAFEYIDISFVAR